MARKNVLRHEVAVAQSLAASFETAPTVVTYLDNCSYQINVTTSNSIGTFSVQGSNDYNVSLPSNTVTDNGTWADLDLGGTPIVNAANDVILINLNQLPFTAIRVAYTSGTAGTGVCDIILIAKQLGG